MPTPISHPNGCSQLVMEKGRQLEWKNLIAMKSSSRFCAIMSTTFQTGFDFHDAENRKIWNISQKSDKKKKSKRNWATEQTDAVVFWRTFRVLFSFCCSPSRRNTEVRVFLQTAGVQVAFKDAPAESVCRHPSLICYENQDYFSLWFRLPQIWSSHSMSERTNLSKQLLVKIVYVTLLVNVKIYAIFSTCKTCLVTLTLFVKSFHKAHTNALDQVWWHFFFANKTVRGWENISKHAVLKYPEMKHAKAKSMGWNNTLMLKVALTGGSPVFCS